jgi:hypothetical protein
MIAVNDLIQMCNEMVNVVSHEEPLEELSEVSCQQLNLLISELNGQGYLSMQQNYLDHGNCRELQFKVLTDDERANPDPNVIDMAPPQSIDGVSRRIGMSYLPLQPIDLQQMSMKNPMTLARSWNYGRYFEPIPDDPEGRQREVGLLRLDGWAQQGYRIFLSSKLPTYTLDDTVYLPDLYNNMLIQGLCCKLCDWHKLGEEIKRPYDEAFTAAKMLIKRQNITQRMMQSGPIGASYKDTFYDGIAGEGW